MQKVVTQICTLLPALRSRRSLLRQIEIDLEREAHGTALYFPLDFYEIHNFLFPLSSGARDPEVVKYYFDNLPHPMILLPPSAWEFIRHLEYQSKWLRRVYHPAAADIDEFLKSRELRDFYDKLEKGSSNKQIMQAYRNMGEYRRILDYVREDAVQTILQEPVQAFVELLDNGRLATLEAVSDSLEWQDLDEQVFELAFDALDERRPTADKLVPNRIDALNMAIVFTLNSQLYRSATGGKFFLLVTHGGATRRAYATLPWMDDPYHVDPVGTFVHRNHLYCAHHAYFDRCAQTDLEMRTLLQEMAELDALQARFESVVQRVGRDGLAKLPETDAGAALDLRSVAEQLGKLDERLAPIKDRIRIGPAEPEPLAASPEFLTRLKSKDKIKAILRECVAVANRVTQEVYDRVQPILRQLPLPMIDNKSEETIAYITSASSEAIPPESTESFRLTATLGNRASNQPLDLGRSYELRVSVRWVIPKRVGQPPPSTPPDELALQVSVQGQDISVAPSQVQPIVISKDDPYAAVVFSVTPTQIGTKQVRVQLYRRLSAVGRVELEFTAAGNHQPPYLDPDTDQTTLHERRPVSPPAAVDHVTVHITIRRGLDDWYEGLIQCEGDFIPTTIRLSPHDLETLNRRLQQAAKGLANCSPAESGRSMSEDQQQALQDLANQGRLAYNEIFDAKAQQFLKSALGGNPEAIIQITSDHLVLPWDLLYDDDPSHALARRFWGMRYIVSRLMLVGSEYVSPQIVYKAKPEIGLITDLSLDAVRLTEVPFFRMLDEKGLIHLTQLRPLEPEREDAAVQEFKKFWQDEFHLAHLACHSFPNERDPYSARLQVSDLCEIPIDKLRIQNFETNGHPMVILNACHTGVVNSLYTTDLARMFLKCGARGVLATECDLPDALAARFAQALYDPLLNGRTLGESLLMARLRLLHQFKDPSGLLYALYAPAGIQLVRS